MDEPGWLPIARELQAIAQAGLAYSRDGFDRQRFARVQELAAALSAAGAGADLEKVLELFRGEAGYPTPKVDVRGAAFVDRRILLVREASDGRWSLPGGWADVNQTAAECVVREIKEESGFDARVVKLAAVWDYRKQQQGPLRHASVYKLFFLCEIVGGAAAPSAETTGVAFFDRAGLPELSQGRVTERQIARMFAHDERRDLAAEFD